MTTREWKLSVIGFVIDLLTVIFVVITFYDITAVNHIDYKQQRKIFV